MIRDPGEWSRWKKHRLHVRTSQPHGDLFLSDFWGPDERVAADAKLASLMQSQGHGMPAKRCPRCPLALPA